MNYKLELYRDLLCSLKRGNSKGGPSNAKPIFLINLFNYIPFVLNNKLEWITEDFETSYKQIFNKFEPSKLTPIIKPFFHLDSEPFYELVWKSNEKPKTHALTPSAKYLRENLAYAKLDNDLWMLLQDEGNRKYLQECVINHYFAQ